MQRLTQVLPELLAYRKLLIATSAMAMVVLMASQVFAWGPPLPVPGVQNTEIWFPMIEVDNTGTVHATWLYTPDGNNGSLFYRRGTLNAEGTAVNWEGSVQTITNAGAREWAGGGRIAVGTDGVVHVAVVDGANNVLYFRNEQRGQPGAWKGELISNTNDFATNADIDVDADNVPYVAWTDGLVGSEAMFAYRAAPGVWVPKSVGGDGNGTPTYLARNISIAVAGSGDASLVHLIWEYQARQNGEFKVAYSRGLRNAPVFVNVTFNDGIGLIGKSDFPDVAVDKTTNFVYITFIYPQGRGYAIAFTRSIDGGGTWATPALLANDGETRHPGNPAVVAVNNIAHVVFEWKGRRNGGYDRALQQIYYFIYNGAAFSTPALISQQGEKASAPEFGIGGPGKAISWVVNDIQSMKYNVDPGGTGPVVTPTPTTPPATPTPTLTPTPERPQGRLFALDRETLNDKKTRFQQIKARFQLLSGGTSADYQYDLSNDGSNFSPKADLPSNNTADWTLAAAAGVACEPRTIRGRLTDKRTNQTSDVLEASIIYDPGVDVSVTVSNPYLKQNVAQLQASGALLQDFGGAGAMNGDPSFTRDPFYYGSVRRNPGECSSIDRVQFGQLTPSTSVGGIPGGLVPIDQFNPADGEYTVSVVVEDELGNSRTFNNFTITLDRTAPQITGAYTNTLRIVDAGGSAISTTSSPLINLRFTNLAVSDTGYGDKNPDKPFFGVWLTNSTQQFNLTEEAGLAAVNSLDWRGVEVTNAVNNGDGTFSFEVQNWSVFTGLQSMTGGRPHYIYARIIDGAGNASTVTIAAPEIELDEDVQPFRISLPLVTRR